MDDPVFPGDPIGGERLELAFMLPAADAGKAIGVSVVLLLSPPSTFTFVLHNQTPPPSTWEPSIGPAEFDAIFNVLDPAFPPLLQSIGDVVPVVNDVPDVSAVPVKDPALQWLDLAAIREMLGTAEPPYILGIMAYLVENGEVAPLSPGHQLIAYDVTSDTSIVADRFDGPPGALIYEVDITEYLQRSPPPVPVEPMGYRADIDRPAGALYFGVSLSWSSGYHQRSGVEALSFAAISGGAVVETFTPSLSDYYPLPDMIDVPQIPTDMGLGGNFLFITEGKPVIRFGSWEGDPDRISAGFAVRLPDTWKTAEEVRVVDFAMTPDPWGAAQVEAAFYTYLENDVANRIQYWGVSGAGADVEVPGYSGSKWSRDEDLTVRRFEVFPALASEPLAEAVDTWGSPQARFVVEGTPPADFDYERGRMIEFSTEYRAPLDGTRVQQDAPPGDWRVRRATLQLFGETEPQSELNYTVQVSIYVGGQLAAVENVPFVQDTPDGLGYHLHWDGWAQGDVEFSLLAPPEVPVGTTTSAMLTTLRSPQVELTTAEMDGQDVLGGGSGEDPPAALQWMDYVNTTEVATTVELDPRVSIMDAQSFQRMLTADPTAQRVVGRLLANTPGNVVLLPTLPQLQDYGYRAPEVYVDEWFGAGPAPGTEKVMSVNRQKGAYRWATPDLWSRTPGPGVFTEPYLVLPIYYGPAVTGAAADIDITALSRGGQALQVTRIGHFARTVFYTVKLAAPDIAYASGLVEDYDTIIINAGEYYSMGICVYGVDPEGGGGGN